MLTVIVILLALNFIDFKIWSIVEQNELKNKFLIVVLVKYIILKKIKISVQRPLII